MCRLTDLSDGCDTALDESGSKLLRVAAANVYGPICSDSKYIIGSQYTWQKTDYQVSGNNNTNHYILVKNKDIFDLLELKASLTGVTLNYEIADPIQATIPPTKAWYPV